MNPSFEKAFAAVNRESDWLSEWRRPFMDQALKVGFPTRKHEEWRYTNLKPITETEFFWSAASEAITAPALSYDNLKDINLTFVNGELREVPKTLPAGLKITFLVEALKEKKLRELLADDLLQGQDTFALLSNALLHHGAVIQVAKNTKLKQRLHFRHYTSADSHPRVIFSKKVLLVEEGAELSICESYSSADGGTFFNCPGFEVRLQAGARLKHTRVQNESSGSYHIALTEVHQSRDSYYENAGIALGGSLYRHNINVKLQASGAETILDGLYALGREQHIDHQTSIDHQAPHCTSSQLYKGILAGTSRAVFSGKVFVRQGAQQTNAFQLNKNLLLSPTAEVDTKPQLEIDADDVKCSHGATVGRLDQEELFYLLSRGIPEGQAQQLLCEAFGMEALKTITDEALLTFVREQLARTLF